MQVESTLTEETKRSQTAAPSVLTAETLIRGEKNSAEIKAGLFSGPLSGLVSSRFAAAFLAFFLLCAGLSKVNFDRMKPADFAWNTWTTWAIKDFLSRPKTPDVVFLGSSLMLVPLDGVDADYTNKTIDGAAHHRSLFFEDHFKKYSGQTVNSFNFALPGEMPSDAYLITRFLLEGRKAPKVLVYGVGPRDFMDNLLPSPSATDPFQYLSRFGDWSDHASLIVPDWQERFNFELTRLVYTYGQRSQLALDANRIVDSVLNKICPKPPSKLSDLELYALRRTNMPDYRPFEVAPNTCLFRPTTDATRPKFLDNIDEYKKRYKTLKMETFNGQMSFLNDILAIAKQRDIHVMLYAMPITEINRGLLSDKSWELYRSRLRQIAARSGASFIDVQEGGTFKFADFQDTVHLHSGGGAKLLDLMAKTIAADTVSQNKLGIAQTTEAPAAVRQVAARESKNGGAK
ncbi:MAG: DUF1574 domain-containing protein [Cyanobacteria bacterium REEB67]|nr:DUF1574 domain-containing protein [Cyanobacteria bacterium REEB67]